MENISGHKSENGLKTLKEQTSNWLKMVKSYYSDLTSFKQKVAAKETTNHVEEQIKQDVLLNINTMMNKVQLEVLQDLDQQEEYLENPTNFSVSDSKTHEFSNSLQIRVEKIKTAIVSLKTRILDFLSRKQFGKRHGFPTSFSDKKPMSS